MKVLQLIKRAVFYKEGEGGRARLALHWALNLFLLLVWCVGIGLLSLYWGQRSYGGAMFGHYLKHAALLALNLAPVLLIALLFFLLTNRLWPAVLGSGVLVMALTHIHYFKLMIRDDPLLAGDVDYFFEAAKLASRYNVALTPGIALCYVGVLLGAVFAFFFMKARFRRAVPRIVCAAVFAAVSLGLYFGVYANAGVYSAVGDTDAAAEETGRPDARGATDRYVSRGFLYPLIHSLTPERTPEGYSKDAAAAALAEYAQNGAGDGQDDGVGDGREEDGPLPVKWEDAGIPEEKKVNMISIMLEAYCDFSAYDALAFETDPYEFFHELQSESYHGTLVTNIFSGGTIDTERCYITGSTEMYDYRSPGWSYAWYFRDQGYFTEFCHPCYEWFYNRREVMANLGFRQEYFFEDRYTLPEDWGIMRDDQFLPDLVTLFDEAVEEGTPYFNFSVTYQNHGPYADDRLDDTEREYVARDDLSEEAYNILNNYFRGIKSTDDTLRELVGHFRDSGEPVVLVLFGDHKPWLGDDSFVYDELGIDLDLSTEQGFYDYYTTQYTIWANDAAKEALGAEFTGEGETISPFFLMMKVFDLCSWEGPAYTQALRELFAAGVTVVNGSGLFVENGELVGRLSREPERLLSRVLSMQYYLMQDWASQYEE